MESPTQIEAGQVDAAAMPLSRLSLSIANSGY